MKVCHKEIDWKISVEPIDKANTDVTYNIEKVSDKKAMDFVQKLEKEGNVSELKVTKKSSFSSMMLLRNGGQQGVRKIVDFRLLNAYAKTWKTHFPGTLATVRMVLAWWRVYISRYLS